ncbi:MAG: ABC transporter ATP-binding protein, partial [Pseudomonadota bacterium]
SPAQIKARAEGKRISARSRLAVADLRQWPGVASAREHEGRVELVSNDTEVLLRRWLAADTTLADLEVRPLPLEDAVLSLTADPSMEETA